MSIQIKLFDRLLFHKTYNLIIYINFYFYILILDTYDLRKISYYTNLYFVRFSMYINLFLS